MSLVYHKEDEGCVLSFTPCESVKLFQEEYLYDFLKRDDEKVASLGK